MTNKKVTEEDKLFSIRLTHGLWRFLKKQAAEEETTMKALLEKLVSSYQKKTNKQLECI